MNDGRRRWPGRGGGREGGRGGHTFTPTRTRVEGRKGGKEGLKGHTLLGVEVILDGTRKIEATGVDADNTSAIGLQLGDEGGVVCFVLREGGREGREGEGVAVGRKEGGAGNTQRPTKSFDGGRERVREGKRANRTLVLIWLFWRMTPTVGAVAGSMPVIGACSLLYHAKYSDGSSNTFCAMGCQMPGEGGREGGR